MTVVQFTDPDTGTPHDHEIVAGDARAEVMLASLLMKAVIDPTALDAVGGVPRRRRHHPEDCPLCALHSRPGPRMWGKWIVAAWQGAVDYRDTTGGGRPHRGVELFASTEHAREVVDVLCGLWNAHSRDRFDGCVSVSDLSAFVDEPPRIGTRLVTSESQLWLWDHEPHGWWPDRVLRFGHDGVEESTGIDIQRMHETGEVRSGVLGDPPRPRPGHIEVGHLVIRATGDSPHLQLVSILDRSSTAPARRVLPDGRTESLGETTHGLTVYGRHAGDRPAVEELARLTPEYADLVTAIHREFHRGTRV
ncbi:hypothetical protein [Nocardia takedensis]|uniref:hypothetical protein n=1 Tax=Nocardia takedensis TaxID=259390 RepID=UPI0005932DCA|nr:hypothetical protein [Nocardia takedensis]